MSATQYYLRIKNLITGAYVTDYTLETLFNVNSEEFYFEELFDNDILQAVITAKEGNNERVVMNVNFAELAIVNEKYSITVLDAARCAGKYEYRTIFKLHYKDIHGAYSGINDIDFGVISNVVHPSSIDVTMTDSNTLYSDAEGDVWDYDPSDVEVSKITIHYEGTNETTEISNPSFTVYRVEHPTNMGDQTPTTVPKSQTTLWLGFSVSNGLVPADSSSYAFMHEYALNIIHRTITNLEFASSPSTMVAYHKLNDYRSQFVLKATYSEGEPNTNVDFTFADGDYYLTSNLTSLSVIIDGATYQVSFTKTLAEPTISGVVVKTNDGNIKTSYELDESFDFTELVFEVHYQGTNYTTNSAFYGASGGFTIELKENNTVILDQNTDFDGSSTLEDLNLTLSDDKSNLVFTITSPITSGSYIISRQIAIVTIKEIIGIDIKNKYTNYVVGEKFLKPEDTTEIAINYIDSNDNKGTKVIPLNSGYSKIIVSPTKDELLYKAERAKKVRISNYTNSVYAEYTIDVKPQEATSYSRIINCYVKHYQSCELPDGTLHVPANGQGLLIIYDDETDEAVGFIEQINDDKKNAKVVLFDDYVPEISAGSSNIDVTFPYFVDKIADEINNCHFGVLFGANNAKNRLFLSGNPKIANADWHSSEPNYTDYDAVALKANGNFTYFSDESIMYYGETDNSVIGYEVVSNDKLLVLKNESDKEKTVYFRSPTLVKAINAAGEEELDLVGSVFSQEEFYLTKGNNSVAGVSPNAIVNFNGDTLFLDSKNQIVGLDVAGILGDNQRYANSRSRNIDGLLRNLDLSKSILWTNNEVLALTVENVGLFVTDFRTYNKEQKQYEWFYLTSNNPTTFLEKDGVIYFGTGEGRLYRYNKNTYADIKKVYSDLTLRYTDDEGKLVVNSEVINAIKATKETDIYGYDTYGQFAFKSLTHRDANYLEKVFYQVANMSDDDEDDNAEIFIDNENGYLEVKMTSDLMLKENSDYYLNYYSDGTIDYPMINSEQESISPTESFGIRFRFVQLEPDGLVHGDRYYLYKQDGDQWVQVPITALHGASICGCIEDEEADVADFHEADGTGDYNTLTLAKDGQTLKLVTYGNQVPNRVFDAELRNYNNVEAFYITAPILANLNSTKTIYSYTLTNDTDLPSEIEVAYASNKLPLVEMKKMSYISLTKEAIGIDFNNLNFNKVDFDKTVVPRTYTMNRVLARQKFICFAFRNYNNTNAVLSSMSVTYSLPFPSYGGD